MKTRLRLQRNHQDDLPAAAHTAANDIATSQAHSPASGILHMQRTFGNAYMQRYLGALAEVKPAPNFISRDAPKGGNAGNAKPESSAPKRVQTLYYMTITTEDGKTIQGNGKGHGRDGKIEVLSFGRDSGRMSGRDSAKRDDTDKPKTTTTRKDGMVTTTIKDRMAYRMSKYPDNQSSVALLDALNKGTPVTIRIEVFRVEPDGLTSITQTVELNDAILTTFSIGTGGDQPIEELGVEAEQSSFTLPETQPETAK